MMHKYEEYGLKKSYNVENILLQSSVGMIAGALMAFIASYLVHFGATSWMIGMVSALASFLVIFLSPIFARWNETSDAVNSVKQVKLVSIIGIISAIILYFTQSLWLILVCYTMIAIIMSLIISLLNTLTGELTYRGFKVNFGIARAANAFVFAVTTPIVGYFVAAWSIEATVIVGILGFLMMFIIAGLIPIESIQSMPVVTVINDPDEGNVTVTEHAQKTGFDRNFKFFLLAVVFLFISQQYINTYMLQMMQDVGGGTSEMSIAFSIGAWTELPIMIFYERINKKFSDESMLIFSGWSFFVKALVTIFAASVLQMYWANSLQFFAFTIYITGSVYYINKKFPSAQVATGQASAVSAMTAGMVIGSLSGGLLIDLFSVNIMQIVGAVSSLLGAIFMTIALKDYKKEI